MSKLGDLTPAAAKERLRQLIQDPSSREPYLDNGRSWLGHTKGAGKIDEMLVEGAPQAALEEARGAVDTHLSYLRNRWKLPIELTRAGLVRFDRAQLGLSTVISAAELIAVLASLGAPGVITKNKHPELEVNYRPRRGHPDGMLDGYWRGHPQSVKPGAGFALHFVERRKKLWIGDYLGTVEEKKGISLIAGNVQCFEIPDLDFDLAAQTLLKGVLKKSGAVAYSYVDPTYWTGRQGNGLDLISATDGPAYKMAQVKQRLQQQAFRNKVFALHGKRCLVTGCEVESLLEAAHLKGREWQFGHNNAEDGIPLRVDIHRAYDKGLIKLDEKHRVKSVDSALHEHYGAVFSAIRR